MPRYDNPTGFPGGGKGDWRRWHAPIPITHGNRPASDRYAQNEPPGHPDDTPPYPPGFRAEPPVDYSGYGTTTEREPRRGRIFWVLLGALTVSVGALGAARGLGVIGDDGPPLGEDGVELTVGRSDVYTADSRLLSTVLLCRVADEQMTSSELMQGLSDRFHIGLATLEQEIGAALAERADVSVEQIGLYGTPDNGFAVRCTEQ